MFHSLFIFFRIYCYLCYLLTIYELVEMLYLERRTLIVYLGNEIGKFIKGDVDQFDF